MNVKERIKQLRQELPTHVKLVAVSKTQPVESIRQAMEAGQHAFGENRVQELVPKFNALPQAQWHMIGHLQTNKVKYIVPFVDLIHAVDSLRLLLEINRQAQRINRVVNCLLQVHIAQEETKFGLTADEVVQLVTQPDVALLTHVCIKGLMGMATFTDDEKIIRQEFRTLYNLFNALKRQKLPPNAGMEILSMGMSHDYRIAIEEGSNMVRIGSAIFGKRK
ncbi:MAG: YggS family pyridoxal phosphate enzyme [Cyclobacteriaceae bacterium]|nr:MAG: YggS family pyridoxal phosphate enzyme [Cyclobacteriaceae bacterium]